MAALDAFDKHILIDVPGCPMPLVQHAVLWASIEFCKRTLAVCYDAESIAVRADIADYDIERRDDDENVEQIITARLASQARPLTPLGRDDLPGREMAGVYAFAMPEANVIRLYGTPSVADTLRCEIAVAPAEDAATVPDELLRYSLAIAAGAKSRLMLIPNEKWTNAQLAVTYDRLFRVEINAAQVEANRRRSRAPARVNPRRFA